MIKVKRVYEAPEAGDGARFLVDHLWPRGLTKEKVHVQAWVKAVAPSNGLRRWFGHEPARWEEFQRRYTAELEDKPESWQPLLDAAQEGGAVTRRRFSKRAHSKGNVVIPFVRASARTSAS